MSLVVVVAAGVAAERPETAGDPDWTGLPSSWSLEVGDRAWWSVDPADPSGASPDAATVEALVESILRRQPLEIDLERPGWLGVTDDRREEPETPSVQGSFRSSMHSDLGWTRTSVNASARVSSAGLNPWALEWSGAYSREGGLIVPESVQHENESARLGGMTISRRFHDRFEVRAGRYSPSMVPQVGTIHGAGGEIRFGDSVKLGAVAGFKPDRHDGLLSIEEPIAAAYLWAAGGTRNRLFGETTLALLGTMYDGEADRLALLARHRLELTSKLRLTGSSEVDFGILDPEADDAVRLTATRLEASSPLTSRLSVRVGFDHNKRPETPSARELMPSQPDSAFERGNWRYWIGGTVSLPGKLRVDGEWSLLDTHDTEEHDRRWRVSLTRSGLPEIPGASTRVSVHNLDGRDRRSGYGGSMSSHVPFLSNRLTIGPSLGFRFLEPDDADFRVTDVSLQTQWRASERFRTYTRFRYAFRQSSEWTMIEVGLEWRM